MRTKGKGAPRVSIDIDSRTALFPNRDRRAPESKRKPRIGFQPILWASLFLFSLVMYAYALPGQYHAGYFNGYGDGYADGVPPAQQPGVGPGAYGIYRCVNEQGGLKWSLQEPYPANEDHNSSYYEPVNTLLIGDGAPWTCAFQTEGAVWK
jgi:hypothetical protein